MRHLACCIAALGIACATSRSADVPPTARAATDPVAGTRTATPVEAAAEFAITTYVDESTRAHGVVCLELERGEDPGVLVDRLSPFARRLAVGRSDCLAHDEPSAILSIGPSQVAGDRARVDVGVVLGSAGMLELERRQGSWVVVRATSGWISLR
jgi:hypothetical protein